MTKDEALRLALEALELEDMACRYEKDQTPEHITKAIIAIKESLSQQNQFNPDWDAMAVMVEEQQRMAKRIAELEAQQEQEPVAWSYWQSCLNDDGTQTSPWVHRLSKFKPTESIINKDVTPLYTTPPHRKPLTDEEIQSIESACIEPVDGKGWGFINRTQFVRAIEAAHGIKE